MINLLPLGSIIEVEKKQKLMIIGYWPIFEEKRYKYAAVLYPAGLMIEDNFVLIDYDCKYEVCEMGYSDDNTQTLLRWFSKLENEMK